MDSDKDGLIDAQKIDMSEVSAEILEIIQDVLFEMEDFNQVLNLEKFT